MYETDPFAARKAVNERQEQAVKKGHAASDPRSSSQKVLQSPEFAHAPEAKMASSLRELVEDAVNKVTMIISSMERH